jgi:hypothetical protein
MKSRRPLLFERTMSDAVSFVNPTFENFIGNLNDSSHRHYLTMKLIYFLPHALLNPQSKITYLLRILECFFRHEGIP